MSHIVTITFNPCIDKSAAVSQLIPEKKLSCTEPRFEPGGGGINVARAIKKLGGGATAIYPSGGYTGKFFNELLAKENIPAIIIEIENSLRENVIVIEESSNRQFRFGFPGAKLTEQEWQQCIDAIDKINNAEFLVASGSLPGGVPDDIFARLATIAKKKNLKLVVDTSKAALRHAANEGVFMLKPNLNELSSLLGRKELGIEEVATAAKQIIEKRYCEVLLVSLGEKGAMLFTQHDQLKVSAPKVEKRSTVGAGDSMVAGFVLTLSQGKNFENALRYGVACGTAATMQPGTELCNKKDADALYQIIASEK
ncbi:MAG TPA: 1-phosphofructokinase family hexose kinase [Chitinophagaceae bacterium]|nr:1-phosphofructokinase family hexose kinase [Chitinophagaceae bacterium]